MFITKMMSKNNTIEYLKKLLPDEQVKTILYPEFGPKTPIFDYIINRDTMDPSILGTAEHPRYILFSSYIKIIAILDKIFDELKLYGTTFILPNPYLKNGVRELM